MPPSSPPPWFEKDARHFYEQVTQEIEGFSPQELAARAEELNRRQVRHLTQECVNLYPGTNIMSPRATALLGSTIGARASEGHPAAKYQTGLRWVEEAETIATELIRRIFGTKYAEVRAMSGSMANMSVLNSLTEPGDTIFSLSTSVGGHISHQDVGAAGYRRLDIHPIPYDAQTWSIDLDALRREVKSTHPKLIILGASLILFPYPVREVRAIADEVGACLMYDAAHVAGLIAGGVWQHPILEGAHVMTASTYKSFGGPPGGIIVTDDEEIARAVDKAIFPGMTANFHTNRLAPLVVAAAEMMAFGHEYAQTCVSNAKALGAAFIENDLNVAGEAQGCTSGHMLALDVRQMGGGRDSAAALEAAHIICNMNLLPWDPLKAVRNPSGLRLAVHEVTRWGMGKPEMRHIAQLFRRVLVDQEPPQEVKGDAIALKSQFNKLHYCFPVNGE
jgi:glycine hydroxymethyltransferase